MCDCIIYAAGYSPAFSYCTQTLKESGYSIVSEPSMQVTHLLLPVPSFTQDGIIIVVASVDVDSGLLLSGPDVVSRGFVYVRESEELMEEIRQIAADAICRSLERSHIDRMELKNAVKDDLTKFLYAKTKRKPMVLPVIMNM